MIANSLERINPELAGGNEIAGDQTLRLHLERYHYAGKHLLPGAVADIACGVGYGSSLLIKEYGDKISNISAVDNDAASIDFAKTKYQHPKISFIHEDATRFRAKYALQNVVSLETIEHLPDPVSFIKHISAQLVSGGRFITSVPITPSMDANPYHLHDFTSSGFRKMFQAQGFKELNSFVQVQKFNPFALADKKEERTKDLRKNIIGYYIKNPYKFFLRLRSVFVDGFSNKYLVAVFEKL